MKKLFVLLFVGLLVVSSFGFVFADTRNYGLFPDMWGNYRDHNTYVSYGYSGSQIIFLDTSEEYVSGMPSIRIDGHTAADDNYGRECDWTGGMTDGYHIAVSPGDVIYYGLWVKTEANTTVLSPTTWHGAYIGFDLYHDNFRMWELGDGSTTDYTYTNFDYVQNYHHLDYGNGWTWLSMNVTIPATWFSVNDYGNSLGGVYQCNYIIPWFGMRGVVDAGEMGSGWFTYATIYKNNVAVVEPSATPTSTPVPTSATGSNVGDMFYNGALWFAVALLFAIPVFLLCVTPFKLGKWGFMVALIIGAVCNYMWQIIAFPIWGLILVVISVGVMALQDVRSG